MSEAPKFGTSGLRGLVTDLTPALVGDYVRAFLAACPTGSGLHVGWDLRPSSPAIAQSVIDAAKGAGLPVTAHGALPTPALALASMAAGQAAVMVTGSHIPADRNGLKFYVPEGEISKDHEAAILGALGGAPSAAEAGESREEAGALGAYVARYADAFGAQALAGLRLGIYEHSSVARDVLHDICRALGAETVSLARSETFIPVDTEAVDPATGVQLAGWAAEHGLDAILSTDGDADRPMLADAAGRIIGGDMLGPLTARMVGAREVVTPVTSCTNVSHMDCFERVTLTRVGSPFVIAGMEKRLAEEPAAKVVGYEANGGFLLGFTADGPAGSLAPLLTRDCTLPLIAPLAAARAQGVTLAELVNALPARFTAADRVQNVPTDAAKAFIAELTGSAVARSEFFETPGSETGTDVTDGLRVSFDDGAIVHLRPSGNAPECRCYAEASSAEAAQALVVVHLAKLKAALS